MQKIVFDARELEHPKPLEEGVKHLSQIDENTYLYMIHRKNPIPLIQIANKRGYQTLSFEDSNAIWHILITKAQDINLETLLDV